MDVGWHTWIKTIEMVGVGWVPSSITSSGVSGLVIIPLHMFCFAGGCLLANGSDLHPWTMISSGLSYQKIWMTTQAQAISIVVVLKVRRLRKDSLVLFWLVFVHSILHYLRRGFFALHHPHPSQLSKEIEASRPCPHLSYWVLPDSSDASSSRKRQTNG